MVAFGWTTLGAMIGCDNREPRMLNLMPHCYPPTVVANQSPSCGIPSATGCLSASPGHARPDTEELKIEDVYHEVIQ